MSGPKLLQDAAIESVKNWKFAWPKPCSCRVKREVTFVYDLSGDWLKEDGPDTAVKWFGNAPVSRVEIQTGSTIVQP